MNVIKQKAISGIKWTSLSSVIGIILQVIQMALLARLLEPKMFGLMALALILIDFSSIFLDMGISSAIIHKPNLLESQLSSLFWMNIFTGVVLFLIIFFLAPVMSDFYHEPQLTNMIRWVAGSFLFKPIEIQFQALLRKEMNFTAITRRDIIAKLVSAVAGIASALAGFGVYSLIILYFTNVLASICLIAPYGLKIYKPRFHFSYADVRPFLRFSVFQTADSILIYFNRQIDALLIGKMLNVSVLGGYNIAKNLAIRPYTTINPVITQVSFPLMSMLQHDDAMLRNIYEKTINFLCSVNFLVHAFLILLAEPVILLVYGQKWIYIVPVFQILCSTFMLRSIFNPMGSLILAKGKPQISFIWNIFQFLLTPISMFFLARFGVLWVAWGQLFIMLLLLWPAWKFILSKLIKLPSDVYFKAILKPAVTTILMCVLFYVINLVPVHAIIKLVLAGFAILLFFIPLSKSTNNKFYLELKERFEHSRFYQPLNRIQLVRLIMR